MGPFTRAPPTLSAILTLSSTIQPHGLLGTTSFHVMLSMCVNLNRIQVLFSFGQKVSLSHLSITSFLVQHPSSNL